MKKLISMLGCIIIAVSMYGQRINGQSMTPTETEGILQVALSMTNNAEVSFDGFDGNTADMLQPDYFTMQGAKAVFTGADGEYSFFYNTNDKVISVARNNAVYPDVLWVIGGGFGHPKAGKANTGWQLDAPHAMQAKKIGEDVYELTMYLESGFDFLSKSHNDWDASHNLAGNKMDPFPVDEFELNFYVDPATGNSHFCRDFMAGKNFSTGVYTVRFDLAAGKCVFCKDGVSPDDFTVSRKINGVDGKFTTVVKGDNQKSVNYQYWDMNLAQGQNMDFEGFSNLHLMVQPEYFTNIHGQYVFNAPTGEYRIWFIIEDKAIYCERLDKTTFDDGVLVITGEGFIHPVKNGTLCDNLRAAWGYELPSDYVFCVNKGNGIHETYLYLEPAFYFAVYEGKDSWNRKAGNDNYTITGDIAALRDTEGNPNFCLDWRKREDFVPGTYRITFDTNNNTANFERVNMAEVNGVHDDGPTSITAVNVGYLEKEIESIYTVYGIKVNSGDNLPKGIYIIRYTDGSSAKMLK